MGIDSLVQSGGIFAVHTDGGIQREFVPFNEHLTALAFAEAIDSGACSVDDLFLHFWSVPEEKDLWDSEDMREEGPYSVLNAWKQLIVSLVDAVADPDMFVHRLNRRDPHLAATCAGYSSRSLDRSTIDEVFVKLGRRLVLKESFEADKAIESIGDLGSTAAIPLLAQYLTDERYVHPANEGLGNAAVAVAKLGGVDLLYAGATRPTESPRNQFFIEAMEAFCDPTAVSRFLFDRFEDGSLYRFSLLCDGREKDLVELVRERFAGGHLNGGLIKDGLDLYIEDREAQWGLGDKIPICFPSRQECYHPPALDRLLRLIPRQASREVIEGLLRYSYRDKLIPLKLSPADRWRCEAVESMLSFVPSENLKRMAAGEEVPLRPWQAGWQVGKVYLPEMKYASCVILDLGKMKYPGIWSLLARDVPDGCMSFPGGKRYPVRTVVDNPGVLSGVGSIVRIELTDNDAAGRLSDLMEKVLGEGLMDEEIPLSGSSWPMSDGGGVIPRMEGRMKEFKERRAARIKADVFQWLYSRNYLYEFAHQTIAWYLDLYDRTDLEEALSDVSTSGDRSIRAYGMLLTAYFGAKEDIPRVKERLKWTRSWSFRFWRGLPLWGKNELVDAVSTYTANALALLQEKFRPEGYCPPVHQSCISPAKMGGGK